MTPYWTDERAGLVLYHSDCRDVLPTLGADSVDLVLTDPPYGIAYDPAGGGIGWVPNGKTWTSRETKERLITGDDEPFDPAPLLRFRRLILWGGNHYADKLPPSPSWLIWWKRRFRDPLVGTDFADCEIAWSNVGGPARVYWHEWNGLLRDSERGIHHHPAMKPEALMRWCIERWSRPRDLVLDAYCGSGTTLVAAKQLGRRAIGIELEERWCETTVKRLEATTPPLFVPEPERATQEEMAL